MCRDVHSRGGPNGREARPTAQWRSLHRCAGLGCLCICLCLASWAAVAQPAATSDLSQTGSADAFGDYFVTTPQLDSALTPLKHLPPDGRVSLRASVTIMADPLETPMGKSFDMQVAALLSAYQSRGYELDGFAFSWAPRRVDQGDAGTMQTTGDYAGRHRSQPSLLLFRKDMWRRPPEVKDAGKGTSIGAPDSTDVAYELVFLVGDAPSYGIQPRAFAAAARCALLFDGRRVQARELMPNESCNRPIGTGPKTLHVIGPTYSGSMQSLAIAIGRLGCNDDECTENKRRKDIKVRLVSPSASVPTNVHIPRHGFVGDTPVEYSSMSWTLKDQMVALTEYLCGSEILSEQRIVFLVEESTFGQGAKDLAKELQREWDWGLYEKRGGARDRPRRPDPEWDSAYENCMSNADERWLSISVQSFPPNIASIRAEHSRLRKAALAARQKVPVTDSRLLELDMSGVEAGNDRPPTYQPSLSSRSDELMLYRLFDTMRVWGMPNVVVIIATDVRDRLFLLSEVRKALPAALPVMLEMDYLVVHPDYRGTSRGVVIIPARDPTVCLRNGSVEPCPSRPTLGQRCHAVSFGECLSEIWRRLVVRDRPRRVDSRDRATFSTDLAANMFRAVHILARTWNSDGTDRRSLDGIVRNALCAEGACKPRLYVATMAGFESLDQERRTAMVAADYRIAMQGLWYLGVTLMALFMLLVGTWLLWGARGTCVMSNFTRHMILDSRWLVRCVRKMLGKPSPEDSTDQSLKEDKGAVRLLEPAGRGALVVLAVIAGAILLVAALRFWQVTSSRDDDWLDPCLRSVSCRFSLAHGRDIVAVYCLWGLYACLALVGGIRLHIAGCRHEIYRGQLNWPVVSRPWLIPVAIMLVVVIMFFVFYARPVSVDARTPWLFAMVALVCGAAFLVALTWHVGSLGRLTLWVSKCIESIRQRKSMSGWPSPQSLQEPMQTPFNLSIDQRDVEALRAQALECWITETSRIINGRGAYPPTNAAFEAWQKQLVAELKLLVVAIRFSAWCAMAAPLTVLLAMSVYAPIHERWLRTASIGLLLIGFVCTVIVVLRLEKDPMLGPMFTRHGDDLTFSGGLRALWPKFVGMGAVLVPLVLPDAWGWLHALIRSINSLG